MAQQVLIVDDSLYMRTIIKDTLVAEGFEVVGQAATGESAIDLALELQPDLITLDNILPDMLGLDVLKVLKKENIKSKIIFISAVGQQSVIQEGMSIGADAYLVKPFTNQQLIDTIRNVLK
ncbi:MAG: response regulator [Cytophagales bacterium]|nr:response regulator [Cytophagales bacterium]MDW8384178.1 response regulator [Flammeovirgaceae bacterium]